MKLPHLSEAASRTRRAAFRIFSVGVFAGTSLAAPARCGTADRAATDSVLQGDAQSRTEKLSNPLNDLLNEAQHDIDNNQFEAAIVPLQKLLAQKPDIAWAHFQLAYAYTALKRVDEARAEYEQATKLDPKMSEAYLNLGILLTRTDPASAVAPLRKAVDLLPAQSRPRFLLGFALERRKYSRGRRILRSGAAARSARH